MRDNTEDRLAALERRLGYQFQNRELLRTALTHTSCLNECPDPAEDNQRLEYLGDAVVDFLIADELFQRFPRAREGELTRWRSQLVSTEALASIADAAGVGEALLLGKGEEASGGRQKPANLAAAVEALAAATYLDAGWEAVRQAMLPLFEPQIRRVTVISGPYDARSQLQEVVQASLGITPRYRTVGERGPDHAATFTVQVLLEDEVWGQGEGPSKRAAAQAAALEALKRLKHQQRDEA